MGLTGGLVASCGLVGGASGYEGEVAKAMSPIRHFVVALVVVGTLAVQGGMAQAAPRWATAGTLHLGDGGKLFHRYRIAIAPDVPNAEIDRMRQAAEHQVDLVEATVLDASTKAFLRRFPIDIRSGEGSHYSGGDSVTIAVDDPNDDRPILLHEDMHVYHIQKLPGGRNIPDILTYYGRAKAGNLHTAGAYLLKNEGEFFEMTASVYLHGHLAREPFTRDELRQKQPVYDRFLSRLFGRVGT